MKPNRKTIAPLLLAGLLLSFFACGKEEEKTVGKEVVRPIKMISVTSTQDSFKRRFPGRVRAAMRADLAFRVSGVLREISPARTATRKGCQAHRVVRGAKGGHLC